MGEAKETLLQVISLANSRLGGDTYNLGCVSQRTLQRLMNQGKIPTAPTIKGIAGWIWQATQGEKYQELRTEILQLVEGCMGDRRNQHWTKEEFQASMFRLAQQARLSSHEAACCPVPAKVDCFSPPEGGPHVMDFIVTIHVRVQTTGDGANGIFPEVVKKVESSVAIATSEALRESLNIAQHSQQGLSGSGPKQIQKEGS